MSKKDEQKNETIEGGKKILKGISKGGALFTKRVAEGMVNASIAQKMQDETSKKVIAAGTETLKGVIKGAEESIREASPDIIEGVGDIASIISKKIKDVTSEDTDKYEVL